MSDAPHEVIDYLREQFARVNVKLDGLREDILDLKRRMTSMERQGGELRVDMAGMSARIDRVETRLERIERRLDLVEP